MWATFSISTAPSKQVLHAACVLFCHCSSSLQMRFGDCCDCCVRPREIEFVCEALNGGIIDTTSNVQRETLIVFVYLFFFFICMCFSVYPYGICWVYFFSSLSLSPRAYRTCECRVALSSSSKSQSMSHFDLFFFLFALNPCVCSCVIWLLTCFDSFMMSFAWRMRIWSWFIWCFHLFIFHSAICFYSFLCVRKWSQICVRDWVRCCVVVCQFEWKRDRRWNWQNKTWQDGVLRN